MNSDQVGWVFSLLFAWIILVTTSFARRYLRGTPFFTRFLLPVVVLAFTLDMLARVEQLALFLLFWVLSAAALLYLMRPNNRLLSKHSMVEEFLGRDGRKNAAYRGIREPFAFAK